MTQQKFYLLSGALVAALVLGGFLSVVSMTDGNDEAVAWLNSEEPPWKLTLTNYTDKDFTIQALRRMGRASSSQP